MKTHIFYRFGLWLILAACFSSCITNREKLYLQGTVGSEIPQVTYHEYRLQVNDEIVFQLMTSDPATQKLYELNNLGGNNNIAGASSNRMLSFRILHDGMVLLPTIGNVPVLGLTIREAQKVISGKFKTLTPDAEVKVALSNNYYYVLGDNGKGRFEQYKDELTVFEALAQAGDISIRGDKKHVKIIRKGPDGKDRIATVDLRQDSIFNSDYYYVQPNDVIYIPTDSKVFFGISSFGEFVSFIMTPVSLILATLTFFNK
jgi:polysaccharide export outer membrane protein